MKYYVQYERVLYTGIHGKQMVQCTEEKKRSIKCRKVTKCNMCRSTQQHEEHKKGFSKAFFCLLYIK